MDTGSPLRALLVEGSSVARDVLDDVLQNSFTRAVEIHSVNTPAEVGADAGQWDLVLVDIDLDPDAALALLRRSPPRAWRVATTLYDDEDRLLPALRSGAHGYLLKQDRIERQVEMLQRTVLGRPEITPAMARGLLEAARSDGSASPEMMQALSALARGSNVRETARELGLSPPALEALVVKVYRAAGTPPRDDSAHAQDPLDGGRST